MNKNLKLFPLLVLISAFFILGIAGFSEATGNEEIYCAPFVSKRCISNISYWYNSCGALQDINQNCNLTNQVCQNGECINKVTIIQRHEKRCYNDNVYWYRSDGLRGELFKNCSDDNSCTVDNCQGGECSNALKCDGSTCAVGSADYQQYCAQASPSPTPGQGQDGIKNLAVSLFGKSDPESMDWGKAINAFDEDKINFLITIKNSSGMSSGDTTVLISSANVTFDEEVRVDGMTLQGDFISGINIGSLSPSQAKSVVFSGTVNFQDTGTAEVIAQISDQSSADFDSLKINQISGEDSGDSENSEGNPIINFIRGRFIWIIAALILTVLFVVIFRRLSSEA